ncbi:MAG: pro-sigmaK processing inhibitor BofA family protein [Oscillospiraceae bacterium]|nr:pro-sigmaK processing inhibitor BofA family protein [Oscillospiraceae bacterium]MBR3474622.1 pro-sigmaK processing inhibitor BofA family protein [Oscillospiraceae bacterium]
MIGAYMDIASFFEKIPFPALSVTGLVIIVFLVMLFSKPLGKMVKLLLHAVLGFVLLFALNVFVPVDELHLEINLPNCIVAGIGGVPGILLLLICQYFFHI